MVGFVDRDHVSDQLVERREVGADTFVGRVDADDLVKRGLDGFGNEAMDLIVNAD